MEQNSCKSGSLASVVCSTLPLDKRLITTIPITLRTIKIWEQFRINLKQKQCLLAAPISANALFPPSLIDSAFHVWANKGITAVKDLFREGNYVTTAAGSIWSTLFQLFLDICSCGALLKNISPQHFRLQHTVGSRNASG